MNSGMLPMWVHTQGIDPSTRIAVPFLACGDLHGWDSDANYELDVSGHVHGQTQQQQQQQQLSATPLPVTV
jgi:hypothetical protein